MLRPRARAASWLTILQRWHKAYCLGARRGAVVVAATTGTLASCRRTVAAAVAEVAVQDGPTEEASALPQDPGQTKIRRKLLSQTRLIGESPTVGQV